MGLVALPHICYISSLRQFEMGISSPERVKLGYRAWSPGTARLRSDHDNPGSTNQTLVTNCGSLLVLTTFGCICLPKLSGGLQ